METIVKEINKIAKEIKMFFAEHPNAKFNIELSILENQKVKVVMKKHLQPEENHEMEQLIELNFNFNIM